MRPPIVFREGERKAKQNTGALDPTRNIGLGPFFFFFFFGVAFLLLLVYPLLQNFLAEGEEAREVPLEVGASSDAKHRTWPFLRCTHHRFGSRLLESVHLGCVHDLRCARRG